MYYLFLTDEELAEKINLSARTIKRYNKELIKKGILQIIKVEGKEIKVFDLDVISDVGINKEK